VIPRFSPWFSSPCSLDDSLDRLPDGSDVSPPSSLSSICAVSGVRITGGGPDSFDTRPEMGHRRARLDGGGNGAGAGLSTHIPIPHLD